MKIETWQEGFTKIIDHIVQLKQDGDSLVSRGSYSSGYFLYFTALEEIAKAYFILARFEKPAPKEFRSRLSDHRTKVQLSARKVLDPELKDLPDMVEIIKEIKSEIPKFGSPKDFGSKSFQLGIKLEERKKLSRWRFRSLYIDIDSKKEIFLLPDEIPIDIVKELKEQLEREIAELQATRDTYSEYKNISFDSNDFKKDIDTQKTLDEIINAFEFFSIAVLGSKEELNKFEGAPSEYKELFLSLLNDEDIDESIFKQVLRRVSELIEKINNIESPKSELEQNQNSFYKERLLEYMPDYEDRNRQEFTYFIRETLRQFFLRIKTIKDLNSEEFENLLDLSLQYLFSLFNITSEDKELINQFKHQLEKTPHNIEVLANLGELYLKVGDNKNAFSCFKKINKLDKKNATAIYYLAEINFRVKEKIKRALSLYKKIEEYYEDDCNYMLFIGNLNEYKKKYRKALNYYWKAVYINFDLEEAWYRIAVINNKKKKTDQAKFFANIVLKINPLHEEAQELHNQLDSFAALKRNDISFRETSNKDFEYLFSLKKSTLKEYVEETWSWDETWQRDYFMNNFNPKETRIITKSGTDVGCLVIKKKRRKVILIGLLLIAPEYQNQGIGSLILEFIINEAKKKFRKILIYVLKVNKRALALYEKIHFQRVGEDNERYHLCYFLNMNDNEK